VEFVPSKLVKSKYLTLYFPYATAKEPALKNINLLLIRVKE
jgi:hypothetical protein